MLENQTKKILETKDFLIVLILFAFFVKGIIFTFILPIFQGPDELTHYSRTQFFNEIRYYNNYLKTHGTAPESRNTGQNLSVSEESENTLRIAGSRNIGGTATNDSFASNSYYGSQEEEILKNNWSHYIGIYPPSTPKYSPFYYEFITSPLGLLLSKYDILVRFFSIRMLSVMLGMAIVYLAYLIFKKSGFSEKNSLLLTAIISFQPMLSATAAIVNYDIMLIFSFTLFIFGATSFLKDGLNIKNFSVMVAASVIGIFTKGPAIVLLVFIFGILGHSFARKYVLYTRKRLPYLIAIIAIIMISAYIFVPKKYIATIMASNHSSKFTSMPASISKYLHQSFSYSKFMFTGQSYWGNFGSLEAKIDSSIVKNIWWIEAFATLGIFYFLVLKNQKRDFLPEKKYIIFYILLFLALEFAIRFYDWRIFDVRGKIVIGGPGRYFLPNITDHFILLATGLGWFFTKEKYFEWLLKTILAAMVILNFYSIFNVIIPRYYL